MKFGSGISTSFIWIIILFDKAFKYDTAKLWGYVWTNAEPLSVEFCNLVQCHILLLFMSMRWDDVFELQPPMALLFIPQTIYEYGDSWRNDTDRWKPKNSEKDLSHYH
jgi:hypothetical protein